jgi:DNA-binding CsgD family transcriptional regulator
VTGYTGAAGRLTRRQGEVLELVKARVPRREIAARLGISEETVKTHVAAIRARLSARTAARELAAARRGGTR